MKDFIIAVEAHKDRYGATLRFIGVRAESPEDALEKVRQLHPEYSTPAWGLRVHAG